MTIWQEKDLFSRSKLWPLLSELYAKEALEAWQGVGVPFYLTSTPFYAKRMAKIAFSYLLENYQAGDASHEPWNIIEIGAGAGRFAYLFLQFFDELFTAYFRDVSKPPSWRYLMLDICEPVTQFWQSHPCLRPYFEKGVLDLSCFNLDSDDQVLLHSGTSISANHPLSCSTVVLAGYLLDTLKAEAYVLSHGRVLPMSFEVTVPLQAIKEGTVATLAAMQYSFEPIDELSPHALQAYEHANCILQEYASLLEEGTQFTISTGGLACISLLKTWCPEGFALITSDQGFSDIFTLREHPKIELGRHGSVSCPVNYHALAKLLELQGNKAITGRYSSHKFVTLIALIGKAQKAKATAQLAQDTLNEFDNENYWRLFDQLKELKSSLSACYAIIKLGEWDPVNFFHLYEFILNHVEDFSGYERYKWLQLIENVFYRFYPIASGDISLLSNLAVMLSKLGAWELAVKVWSLCEQLDSQRADVHFNLGIGYCKLGDTNFAMQHLIIAQKLNPQFNIDGIFEK